MVPISAPASSAAPCLAVAALLVALVACGAQSTDPRCAARRALIDGIRAVDLAESAERSGDAAAIRSQLNEVTRLVRLARSSLSADVSVNDDGPARSILEAANYLEFIVADFETSGSVDGTLAQFASRELNRAVSGAGGAPFNC